jgi:hypothetical protein
LAICSRSFRVRSFKSTGVINGLYLRTLDCRRSFRGTSRSRSLTDDIRSSDPTWISQIRYEPAISLLECGS